MVEAKLSLQYLKADESLGFVGKYSVSDSTENTAKWQTSEPMHTAYWLFSSHVHNSEAEGAEL